MNTLSAFRRCVAAAAFLACAVVLPNSAIQAQHVALDAGDAVPVRLTARDVSVSNGKAAAAYGALVAMWSTQFEQIGMEFAVPRLARYRGAIATRCGAIAPSNASYCFAANTIYFDDVFLAAQAKSAGQTLGTDGDMVAVGIIAHEMGHAVAMQLGHLSRDSYRNESVADCLAGAFARQAEHDGSIEAGDIDEAFFGMAAAGDPTLRATGDARFDARSTAHISARAHGTREQRMGNFRSGLEQGGGACLVELRG